jgi:hypothetical protein
VQEKTAAQPDRHSSPWIFRLPLESIRERKSNISQAKNQQENSHEHKLGRYDGIFVTNAIIQALLGRLRHRTAGPHSKETLVWWRLSPFESAKVRYPKPKINKKIAMSINLEDMMAYL